MWLLRWVHSGTSLVLVGQGVVWGVVRGVVWGVVWVVAWLLTAMSILCAYCRELLQRFIMVSTCTQGIYHRL